MYSGRNATSINSCTKQFYFNENKITEFEMIDNKTPQLRVW